MLACALAVSSFGIGNLCDLELGAKLRRNLSLVEISFTAQKTGQRVGIHGSAEQNGLQV